MKKQLRKAVGAAVAVAMIMSMTACSGKAEQGAAGAQTEASGKEAGAAEKGSGTAQAELSFPEKDITIIVPFDAGGGNDIVARLIAKVAMDGGYFGGKNVIIENQPGGGGAIGQAYVANTAEPDGYTLLTFTASGVTNPILKDVPFSVDDFKTIVCCNADPAILIARADAPFDDVKGLLEYAKTNKLIINDSGFGTSSHIRTLDWTGKLEKAAGVTIEYQSIHADSGNMQISELMGGHADVTCLTAGECSEAILEGNVKAIAIMTEERFEGLPDVPTFKELGYEGFIDGADRAISCSSKVPDDVYQYLVGEFTRLCSSEEFIKAMTDANLVPACRSAEEYQKFIDFKTELVTSLKDYLLAGEE
ncbi:tripartite tricarboxylate transporter substrate binding protein [Clostridium sp. AN503]|uniref:tripartite tricarboxylate transporter substrate binding protein n=1 Tax=Clostridium sp. AN503 TaxID=3160598 RepID=UPI0034593038